MAVVRVKYDLKELQGVPKRGIKFELDSHRKESDRLQPPSSKASANLAVSFSLALRESWS